ncbi:MAG: NADH:ubiquinone reductase (Na(+)-transporting) subunit F [Yoonia sp.]|nr:NADH:ubiquinone reductase (Na(+)-transporting) subunit F [Yoonia sp.]
MSEIALGSLLLIVIVLVLSLLVVGARAVLMPQHPATVTVNGQTKIAVTTGQKLLSALNDNGILIPSSCAGAGTCGLCRVHITNGGPAPLPVEAGHFTKSDLRDGLHLACQVVLRGDMDVTVPDDMLGAETFDCQVVSTRQLTPLIREIVVQLPDGTRPDIYAGSFMQVTAPPFALSFDAIAVPDAFDEIWRPWRGLSVKTSSPVTRAYSVSNRPEDTAAGRVVLDIRLALPPPSVANAPPGIVSSWLFSLVVNDTVSVAGPFGTFRSRDTDREMVFIGGGVGMAPLRAMIYEQLERVGTTRKISFWYGSRNTSELLYVDEFDALAARHANFDWTVALSEPEPDAGWTGAVGFVHDVALERYLREHPSPENCEYYICGPPLMIRAVLSMLDELGVDNDHIFNDDFGV